VTRASGGSPRVLSSRLEETRGLVPERFLGGLGLFPEVLVLERFLEGSTPISLFGRSPKRL
jgi:hypothetical protein